jgi:head-tail adaptor
MSAGKLDQRVTFRRLTRTADGGGGVTEAWADFATNATVWAKVTFKGAREGLDEGRINASQMTTFEVYTRADVTELDGLIWGGEFYNIRTIRRYGERPLMMWLDAERGVAN